MVKIDCVYLALMQNITFYLQTIVKICSLFYKLVVGGSMPFIFIVPMKEFPNFLPTTMHTLSAWKEGRNKISTNYLHNVRKQCRRSFLMKNRKSTIPEIMKWVRPIQVKVFVYHRNVCAHLEQIRSSSMDMVQFLLNPHLNLHSSSGHATIACMGKIRSLRIH